ncbi:MULTISPECIES: hypothetical protein [unclassified Mesorhizobium]|nr:MULTISPECIES: hypothetical protein [unclassified Mesorhizobium]
MDFRLVRATENDLPFIMATERLDAIVAGAGKAPARLISPG